MVGYLVRACRLSGVSDVEAAARLGGVGSALQTVQVGGDQRDAVVRLVLRHLHHSAGDRRLRALRRVPRGRAGRHDDVPAGRPGRRRHLAALRRLPARPEDRLRTLPVALRVQLRHVLRHRARVPPRAAPHARLSRRRPRRQEAVGERRRDRVHSDYCASDSGASADSSPTNLARTQRRAALVCRLVTAIGTMPYTDRQWRKGRIPRHRHRHPREDPREEIARVGCKDV